MTPTGGSHGKPHRTTKILSDAWRRSSCVAARDARATSAAADDRISPWRSARRLGGPAAWISPGPEGGGLRRGRERGDRVPLDGGSTRSAAGAGGRACSPQGFRERTL